MGKVGPKLKELSFFFHGNKEKLFQFCTGRLEVIILHILDPNYSSFYLKCPRKYKRPIILTFFDTSPNLHLLPSHILRNILNLIIPSYVYIIEV